jgi:2',3'-cyclic-nucleotide 2'-phosphodiesterase / 3'-nucleotidase
VVKKSKKTLLLTWFLLVITLFMVCNHTFAEVLEPSLQVRILETTDLHAKMLGYDYEKKTKTVEYGLEWTASLIKQSRKEFTNTLLFDVGDVLVGYALGEYAIKSYLFHWMEIHPVYKAMNTLDYDAATVGNHEFNYGINYLIKSLRGANFPYVNANIYLEDSNSYDGDDINYFRPYTIIEKVFEDENGNKHRIKVGVIGLLTPIAEIWDKEVFSGKLKIKNMRETAEHFVPIMKERGADIVVALVHSGLEADDGLKHKKGNSVYSVSKVDGIDAILYGHSHSLFPNKEGLPKLKGIDINKGKINGTATVQAGYWGNHLGIIDLDLKQKNGKWEVIDSQSFVKPIFRTVKMRKVPVLPADKWIKRAVIRDHRKTLEYLR